MFFSPRRSPAITRDTNRAERTTNKNKNSKGAAVRVRAFAQIKPTPARRQNRATPSATFRAAPPVGEDRHEQTPNARVKRRQGGNNKNRASRPHTNTSRASDRPRRAESEPGKGCRLNRKRNIRFVCVRNEPKVLLRLPLSEPIEIALNLFQLLSFFFSVIVDSPPRRLIFSYIYILANC